MRTKDSFHLRFVIIVRGTKIRLLLQSLATFNKPNISSALVSKNVNDKRMITTRPNNLWFVVFVLNKQFQKLWALTYSLSFPCSSSFIKYGFLTIPICSLASRAHVLAFNLRHISVLHEIYAPFSLV